MSVLVESVEALEVAVKQQAELISSLEADTRTLRTERDRWMHDFNMYRSAWLREIGGVIRNKAHEIDGFVLRTRDIYEGYTKWVQHERIARHETEPKGDESGGH